MILPPEEAHTQPNEEIDVNDYITSLRQQLDAKTSECAMKDALVLKLRRELAEIKESVDGISSQIHNGRVTKPKKQR